MKLLIYEPNHTGHHFAYLARMLPGVTGLPIDIIVATKPRAIESDEFDKTLKDFGDRLEYVTCCSDAPGTTLGNARHRANEFLRTLELTRPDHAWIMYGDGLWQILAVNNRLNTNPIASRIPIEAWLYRGGFSYPTATGFGDRMKRLLFRRLARKRGFTALHLDDEYLYDFARVIDPGPSATEMVLTPNPIELRPLEPDTALEARKRLGLPEQGRIVSLTGMIDSRKGADLLIRAFAEHHRRADAADSHLVLGGPHDDRIKAVLEEPGIARLKTDGHIICQDRFFSADEMFDVAAASTLVTAPYPNHSGRSSIILWAAAAGRPSLGVDRGCIDRVITEEKLGWTCDVSDIEAFARAIGEALEQPWGPEEQARVRRYAEFHRVENYQRIASSRIRRRLDMTAAHSTEEA
ncbi:MAG: hypothetical protein CMJ32_07365 [Phycisphaerae bacterium]|nr:hypothetical protein [Phycisphaerae bacterium]